MVDLDDVSIAGNSAEDLLPVVVFGMDRTAVKDVAVGGGGIQSPRRVFQARIARVGRG